jgi:membrane protease YdiL (CAAX protease family)
MRLKRRERYGLGALLLLALLYNNLTSLFPKEIHDQFYLPANLFTLAVIVLTAVRYWGGSKELLGLAGAPWQSLRLGTALGLLLPAPIFVLAAWPELLDSEVEDPRVAASVGKLLFIVLLRIPLGTALFEEVLFRGLLYGKLRKMSSPMRAALLSSAAFGVWHVSVTVRNFRDSDTFDSIVLLCLAVLGVVVATFVGGLLFCWMRWCTGHIAGSTMTHWLVNALSAVAMYLREQRLL